MKVGKSNRHDDGRYKSPPGWWWWWCSRNSNHETTTTADDDGSRWLDQQRLLTCQECSKAVIWTGHNSSLCAAMTASTCARCWCRLMVVVVVCLLMDVVTVDAAARSASSVNVRSRYAQYDALFVARCEARCWRTQNKSSVRDFRYYLYIYINYYLLSGSIFIII